jgi:uncharacterized membrane protein
VKAPAPVPDDATLPPSAYLRMALLLRFGLLLSLGLLLGAIVAYLVAHPSTSSAQAISSNPIIGFLNLPGLVGGLVAGAPTAYLTLGLVVLVATPVLRVATGFYYFQRGGERALATITLVVLVLLLVGILVIGPLVR